jgi:hypothetical protein
VTAVTAVTGSPQYLYRFTSTAVSLPLRPP